MKTEGEKLLDRHLSGESLTLHEAVLAKCADCMSSRIDKIHNCEITKCSLYPFSAAKQPHYIKQKTDNPGASEVNGRIIPAPSFYDSEKKSKRKKRK